MDDTTGKSWSWSNTLPKKAEVHAIFAGGENNMDNRTLCVRCSHSGVCTYKNDFLKIQTTIDELAIPVVDKDSKINELYIRDIPFIKPITVVCKFYSNDISYR